MLIQGSISTLHTSFKPSFLPLLAHDINYTIILFKSPTTCQLTAHMLSVGTLADFVNQASRVGSLYYVLQMLQPCAALSVA